MELNKNNIKNILLLAVVIVMVYQLSDNIKSVFDFFGTCLQIIFPFLLGAGIAFVLNVPLRFFERKIGNICKNKDSVLYKKKRIISFLITLVFVLGVLVLISFLVIPQLTVTIKQVIDQVPKFYDAVSKWLEDLQERLPQLKDVTGNLEESWDVIGTALSKITSDQVAGMFSSTVGIITGVVDSLTTFFIAIVFACYILFQKETLSEQCKKLLYGMLPVKTADRTIRLGRMADKTFSGFLTGQCMEAFILGMMFVVSMWIFGMPYNVMIGVLIGVTALIPIVGAFVGCFVGAFLILMVNPMQAVMFVILFLVLQQIEGNLIYPRVVGNSVGLPAIWVLAAVTIGGNLMGVAGMLVGIPIVSILYTLLARYVNVKLMAKNVAEYKWRNREERPNPVNAEVNRDEADTELINSKANAGNSKGNKKNKNSKANASNENNNSKK